MKLRSLASREHRPLIGVTTSEVRPKERVNPVPEGEPIGKEMALGTTYLKAIEEAGGLPVVMPPMAEDAIEPLLDRLDGICLSGGPDLDPALYEAKPHPELGPIEPDLDRLELAVAARADTIVVAHGGPFDDPSSVQICFDKVDVHGFLGASSIERLPVEIALRQTVAAFAGLKLRRS